MDSHGAYFGVDSRGARRPRPSSVRPRDRDNARDIERNVDGTRHLEKLRDEVSRSIFIHNENITKKIDILTDQFMKHVHGQLGQVKNPCTCYDHEDPITHEPIPLGADVININGHCFLDYPNGPDGRGGGMRRWFDEQMRQNRPLTNPKTNETIEDRDIKQCVNVAHRTPASQYRKRRPSRNPSRKKRAQTRSRIKRRKVRKTPLPYKRRSKRRKTKR